MKFLMALNVGFGVVNGIIAVIDHNPLNLFACAFAAFMAVWALL